MFFRTRLCFLLLGFSINSFCTEAPSLRCISVAANGDITLSWQAPSDPLAEFFSYHIFSGTSSTGPYTDVGTVSNIAITTFFHPGADANNVERYYYIKTYYGAGGISQSSASDTLQAILLKTTKPFNNSAVAGLSWNPIHVPLFPSSKTLYKIWKQMPASAWFLLDSTFNTSYADTNNGICSKTFINYQIKIGDNLPCESVSSVARDEFNDLQAPLKTKIIRVSVDPTQKANISWQPNTAKDLKGYTIYKKNILNQFNPIATVSKFVTNYSDPLSDPSSSPDVYTVLAFDSCENNSEIDTAGHNTIHLKTSIDLCERSINLQWNKYINWEAGVQEYQVFRSENGGAYVFISSVSPTSSDYKDMAIVAYNSYQYFVTAIENMTDTITSNSNITPSLLNTVSIPPAYLDLTSATVDISSQKVNLSFSVDYTAKIKNIKILRSEDNVSYTSISLLPPPVASNNVFTDNSSAPQYKRYFYKITTTDSCDRDVIVSEPAGTIFLTSAPLSDYKIDLFWNDYFGWDASLSFYRSVSNNWESIPFTPIINEANYAQDSVSQFVKSLGEFCYYLVAEKLSDPSVQSYSNISCATLKPKIFVPNAFSPNDDGLNDVFLPVNVFVDPQSYSMIIYDRWGNPIFESNHPETGWNGTVNGKGAAPFGVYAYHIKWVATNGLKFEKTGSISLLK